VPPQTAAQRQRAFDVAQTMGGESSWWETSLCGNKSWANIVKLNNGTSALIAAADYVARGQMASQAY